jgi:hypothetical protein
MTAQNSPAAMPAGTAGPAQRAALLHFLAGALGVLSFIWGFLTWFTEGHGGGAFHFAGYAFSSAGVAPIGLSILAGAIAVANTVDGKIASFVPSAVAISALLTVIGVAGGKGNVGPGDAQIGMGVGLILELITCVVQVAVLLIAWLAANGRLGVPRPPAHPGYPTGGTPRPGYPVTGYGAPAPSYPPPAYPGQQHPQSNQPYPGQPYPGQPHAGYGPPSYSQPGYHPPAPSAPPPEQASQPEQPQSQPGERPSNPPTEQLRPPAGGYGESEQ